LQGLLIQVMAVFSFVNVVLLLALVGVYYDSFRKIRAQFTAGLIFFAAILLVQNLLALYSYLAMFMYYADAVTSIVLAITIAQTVGVVTLLWLSVR